MRHLLRLFFTTLTFLFIFNSSTVYASDNVCSKSINTPLQIHSSGWSRTLEQSRSYNFEQSGLNAQSINELEVAWSYVFEDSVHPRSLPAISSQAIFIGSESEGVLALDIDTGCQFWQFYLEEEVRTAISVADVEGQWVVFFSDVKANVYALDALTGKLLWKNKVHEHKHATGTGSPVYYNKRLYVPVSSKEVAEAANPFFPCCTFRGALIALDALSGEQQWRFNTIDEEAKPTHKNFLGVQSSGPSGAAIWSAPTIDIKRQRIYVGTGQNYTSPTTDKSDAIIAIDLNTGKLVWVQQTVTRDAWNPQCLAKSVSPGCPKEEGNDYDFGAPPILITLDDGRDVILAGQKSGTVFAMDPDNKGQILWQNTLGRGGLLGGIHWGMAATNKYVYVGVSDVDVPFMTNYEDKPRPGLNKLDINTGELVWHSPAFFDCARYLGQQIGCRDGISAAISKVPGAIFAGGMDGILRAYSDASGEVIWQFDSKQETLGVNGIEGSGGTIDAGGPVIAGGRVLLNSGYGGFLSAGSAAGNVLWVLKPKLRE